MMAVVTQIGMVKLIAKVSIAWLASAEKFPDESFSAVRPRMYIIKNSFIMTARCSVVTYNFPYRTKVCLCVIHDMHWLFKQSPPQSRTTSVQVISVWPPHMPHYGTCRTTSSRRNMDGRQRSKIDRIIGHACLCSSNINAHKHSVVVQCWSGHCMQCCLQRHEPRCPNIFRVWIRQTINKQTKQTKNNTLFGYLSLFRSTSCTFFAYIFSVRLLLIFSLCSVSGGDQNHAPHKKDCLTTPQFDNKNLCLLLVLFFLFGERQHYTNKTNTAFIPLSYIYIVLYCNICALRVERPTQIIIINSVDSRIRLYLCCNVAVLLCRFDGVNFYHTAIATYRRLWASSQWVGQTNFVVSFSNLFFVIFHGVRAICFSHYPVFGWRALCY